MAIVNEPSVKFISMTASSPTEAPERQKRLAFYEAFFERPSFTRATVYAGIQDDMQEQMQDLRASFQLADLLDPLPLDEVEDLYHILKLLFAPNTSDSSRVAIAADFCSTPRQYREELGLQIRHLIPHGSPGENIQWAATALLRAGNGDYRKALIQTASNLYTYEMNSLERVVLLTKLFTECPTIDDLVRYRAPYFF
jgi:hypothetical protein